VHVEVARDNTQARRKHDSDPESPHTTVLLIGASRGLGLPSPRNTSIVVHSGGDGRSAQGSELHDLQGTSAGRLEIEHVDITIPEQVVDLYERLASRTFDLLFVNAGVTNNAEDTIADVSTEEFTRLMVTNALSPMRVIEKLKDLVAADGTIAVMSSGQGSIANNERGGFEVYRGSKAALNCSCAATRLATATRAEPCCSWPRAGSRLDSAARMLGSPSARASQPRQGDRSPARPRRASIPRLSRRDRRMVNRRGQG